MTRAINIWRLSDRRAGHDNQSLGLVDALSRRRPVETITIEVNGAWHGARQVLGRRDTRGSPALIIGAGHATHAGLLFAAWWYRARSVVLMSPSLPYALFDLCIVPKHDGAPARANVLQSLGALNRVQVGTQRDPKLAVILLGGPSRHFAWEQDTVLAQVRELLKTSTALHWLIASSPRTPADTVRAVQALCTPANVQVMKFEDSPSNWLAETLGRASLVWVTEDSMSMAYEALSSGAPTGLLQVCAPPATQTGHRSPNKLLAAVRALRDSGRVMSTAQWLKGQQAPLATEPLREADRCAEQILLRWPELQ